MIDLLPHSISLGACRRQHPGPLDLLLAADELPQSARSSIRGARLQVDELMRKVRLEIFNLRKQSHLSLSAQLQSLIARFPNHPRVPAAMLTLGNCQLESGNKAAAKKIFSEIVSKYPDSDAAQQAQSLISATK